MIREVDLFISEELCSQYVVWWMLGYIQILS